MRDESTEIDSRDKTILERTLPHLKRRRNRGKMNEVQNASASIKRCKGYGSTTHRQPGKELTPCVGGPESLT